MHTVGSISRLLGISDEAVLQHIHAGRLAASNVGCGAHRPRWRVSQAALDAFLAARATSPKVAQARRRKQAQAEVIEFYS